jgi:NAD(P)-dependent dehydrogenase (short-subunit alcohol dehydrogenase family)
MNIVVVTGSAGGIGQSIVHVLKQNGWTVVGIDLTSTPGADDSLIVDLSNPIDRETKLKQLKSNSDVAAVVHVAAIQDHGGVGELDPITWDKAMQTNVIALDHIAGLTKNALIANTGSVIAISSVHAATTTPGIISYSASKGALEAWVRSASLELAPRVTVNAIRPGAVNSAKLQEGFARWGDKAAGLIENLIDRTPSKRLGQSDEVASLCEFLLSDKARFITGSVFTIDGGATAKLATE